MNDHPDLRDLPTPATEQLTRAKAQAIPWFVLIALMLALPAIVWLWRWAI